MYTQAETALLHGFLRGVYPFQCIPFRLKDKECIAVPDPHLCGEPCAVKVGDIIPVLTRRLCQIIKEEDICLLPAVGDRDACKDKNTR